MAECGSHVDTSCLCSVSRPFQAWPLLRAIRWPRKHWLRLRDTECCQASGGRCIEGSQGSVSPLSWPSYSFCTKGGWNTSKQGSLVSMMYLYTSAAAFATGPFPFQQACQEPHVPLVLSVFFSKVHLASCARPSVVGFHLACSLLLPWC